MSCGSFPVPIDGHTFIDFNHDGKGRREQKFDVPYILSAGEHGMEHVSLQCSSDIKHEDLPEPFFSPRIKFYQTVEGMNEVIQGHLELTETFACQYILPARKYSPVRTTRCQLSVGSCNSEFPQ